MNEPTDDIKRALIDQEIANWQNSRYVLQMRHRVQIGIGAPKEILDQIVADLERHEKALDLLTQERTALNGEEKM